MDDLQQCQAEIRRLRYWVVTYENYIEELRQLLKTKDIDVPIMIEE